MIDPIRDSFRRSQPSKRAYSHSRLVPRPARRMSAADVRNVRVGEIADEPAQRIGPPVRVRIRECEDFAARGSDGVSCAAVLPPRDPHRRTRVSSAANASTGRRSDPSIRPRRSRSRACEADSRGRAGSRGGARSRRFIVGGDHERHGRLDVSQTDGSRPKACQPCDRQRVAHMGPAEAPIDPQKSARVITVES